MRVIGLFGLIGSGKDTVSDYLIEKHGYTAIIMGDIVRELATKRGLEWNRDNLDMLQKEYTAKHGIDFFAKEVVKRVKDRGLQKVVINGIRRPEDAQVPKNAFGKDMILVQVDVDAKIRFERMRSRARVGDPKTLEEFLHQENQQKLLFDFNTLQKLIDHKVSNSGTLDELHNQVDALLKKTGFA